MKGFLKSMFKGTVKAILLEVIEEGFSRMQASQISPAVMKQKLIDLVNEKLG